MFLFYFAEISFVYSGIFLFGSKSTDGFSEAANLGRRFWAGVPRSPGRCSSEATEEAQPTGRA